MAHERTELELGPGVNVLTGPNNTGKSAIVEALRCVATNPIPRHYIRHGAKEARVTVEVEDGAKVVWIRKKRSSGYELWAPGAEEPQEYWKFGRKPPQDVLDVLRLNLVALEGDKDPIDVHIGNQRDPVFLLNQPKSDAAAFFAASTESAHLLAMQNLLKRKTMEAKRREKDLVAGMAEAENRLDLFSPLPSIEMELDSARKLEETANHLQRTIPMLEQALATQAELNAALRDQRATMEKLDAVRSAPTIGDTAGLSVLGHQITSTDASLRQCRGQVAAMSGLTSVPATEETRPLARLCKELQTMEQARAKGDRRVLATAGLREPPTAKKTEYLSDLLDELLAHQIRIRRGNLRRDYLLAVQEPPKLESVDHLQGVMTEVVACQTRMEEVRTTFHMLENRLEILETTIRQRLGELGCCPTCGADLDSVAFLDQECRHDA